MHVRMWPTQFTTIIITNTVLIFHHRISIPKNSNFTVMLNSMSRLAAQQRQ